MRPTARWLAATLLLLGCADDAAPPPQRAPVDNCSDLARFLLGAEQRDLDICGRDTAKTMRRELIPLGAGNVLEWIPIAQTYRRWSLGGDPPLPHAAGPLVSSPADDSRGRMLIGLGNNRILQVSAIGTDWRLFNVNLDPLLTPLMLQAEHSFDTPGWGQEIVALDEGYLLRWKPGNGSYVVYSVDVTKGLTENPFKAEPGFGGNQPDFRRGARLVNLKRNRLLTWEPRKATYKIRRYRFDGGQEIFDPPTEYPWTPLEPTQELLVVDDGKILKWDQKSGSLELDGYDLDAENPLLPADSPVIARQGYGSDLMSEEPPVETASKIKKVVILLQQGRSFDSLFGQYCTAPSGADLSDCHQGGACCEAMPRQIPGAAMCAPIDPAAPSAHVPKDDHDCLLHKIYGSNDDRQNDGYADTNNCGDPLDFACAGDTAYRTLAAHGALADRYFQTNLYNAEANFLYLAKTAFGSIAANETGPLLPVKMADANVRWALYIVDPFSIPDPDRYNQKHPAYANPHWTAFRFPEEIDRDIEQQQLGDVSVVSLPPPYDGTPSSGPLQGAIDRVTGIVDKLLDRDDTLIVVAFVTSGGYYDHVEPPAPLYESTAGLFIPYGPRLPFLVLGHFAKPGYVSHVPIEMSSMAAFAEWNWLGGVGQLDGRDKTVAPIGDLIDPAKNDGAPVPSARPDAGR